MAGGTGDSQWDAKYDITNQMTGELLVCRAEQRNECKEAYEPNNTVNTSITHLIDDRVEVLVDDVLHICVNAERWRSRRQPRTAFRGPASARVHSAPSSRKTSLLTPHRSAPSPSDASSLQSILRLCSMCDVPALDAELEAKAVAASG